MLKFYIVAIISIISYSLFSQTTIISLQDFDETSPQWSFTSNISFFDNNSDGFFGVHNGNIDTDINDTGIAVNANNINYSNIINDFLFINDLNDEGDNGTNGEAKLTFDTIDITTYSNVYLSFDYEIIDFESADYINYQIIEDGIHSEIKTLPKNNSGTITIPIQNKIQFISLDIIIKQNGINDYAAIDNIKLEGELIIPCSELMISEYVEGTSSSSHRNNFIEIYNPTNQNITLENYSLTKFTNDNLNPTGNISLTGIISPYSTYLVEDENEILGVIANLSSSSSVMDFNGNDKIALLKNDVIIDLIGTIGENINFAENITLRRKSHIQNTNSQYNENEWDFYELEDVSDINKHVSLCSGAIPEIEIYGNLNKIIDGSSVSNFENNTYFGAVNVSQGLSINKSYLIKNLGNDILEISNIEITGVNNSDFSLQENIVANISPNNSINFNITFQPSDKGIKTATIIISNNDASENPYNFIIQGEATGISNSPLMITQYYEGEGNNKWIEITNISNATTPPNFYYLALYRNDDAQNPLGIKPSIKKIIPPLNSGQTIKYCSTLNVTLPNYAIDGNEIKTTICSFTGDDIIIISTTNDETCWENKMDIIGNSNNWGAEKSFVRKYGCTNTEPKSGFNLEDWMVFEVSEINSATAGYNLRVGEHYIGETTFENNNNWNNGLPDIYRDVIINQDYNSDIYGNIEACNLTVNENISLNVNVNNYLSLQNNLNVNGVLNILNEGSLLMANSLGIISNNGVINIHKTTTTLKKHDYTYWSSPIKNAILEEVFIDSPQNSFYKFDAQNYLDSDNDGYDDDANAWQIALGKMEVSKGYTAMAPNTNPFENTQSLIFSGVPNNGNLTSPIYLSNDNTNEDDDWNFIGNPYPSAIDATLFLNDENNKNIINGSIYFWTHNTSATGNKYDSNDYAMYTVNTGGIMANSKGTIPTGFIASCQGFFVEAKQQGNIEFNNAMRVKTENTNFFKGTKDKNHSATAEHIEKDKIWLNLFNDEGAFSQILIGFLEGATTAYESNFDGLRFSGNDYLSFFSMVENQQLAIQGVSTFKGNETILLGFLSKIEETVTLKIGIDHLEGSLKEQNIYLVDNLLNKTHNLSLNDYEFTLQQNGLVTNRFSIVFNSSILSLEDIKHTEDSLIITKNNETIQVSTTSHSVISSILIYDILGRKLKEVKANQSKISFSSQTLGANGVYILHAKLDDYRILNKKFIK